MKVAVTLASGQLGTAIVNELKTLIGAANVVGFARSPEKASHLGIEVREGDYNNAQHFKNGLTDVDAIVLVSGNDKPENRIQQHRNVIDGAKANNVKKIVYTSIIGAEEKTAFSPVVNSNRKTEQDVKASGIPFVIGRNGIYIEPDLEYIEQYKKEGGIINCAQDGKCVYTSRPELSVAYAQMAINDSHLGQIYNLAGNPITQSELAENINTVFNTDLKYKPLSVDAYLKDRQEALGEFMGTVIAGIYEGIKIGACDVNSTFAKASGRPHKTVKEMMEDFKNTSA